MIIERLLNSLQYRLSLEEKEWRATSKLRRELALSPFHRFLLVIGRRPVFWGLWLFGLVFSISLFLAVVDPEQWTIIRIAEFKVSDGSAYFIGLWSVQAAIAALVYPIVIAFVTVLLQLSNNAKADLYIYLHDSSATPAGLSALLLIVAMGLQYVGLPYVPKETVFAWSVIDALWFAFNTAITIRFLLHTFDFILPSKRDDIVRRYAINVAWPAEVRAHLAKHIFLTSTAAGLIPGPNYAEQKGDAPSVLPGQYGVKQGEPCVTLHLHKEKALIDIRFKLLSWVIGRWKLRADLQPEATVFEIPLTPFETYEGDVILVSLQGKTSLTKAEKFILRHAFVFGRPKIQTFALSINDIIAGIQGCAKASIRSGQLDRYESDIKRMTDLYRSIIEASDVLDSSGKIMSMSEIGDREQLFGGPVYESWNRNIFELIVDAAKKIGEDTDYIISLSSMPNQLFNAAKEHSTPRLPIQLLLLSHIILRKTEDWWTDSAERLGFTEHSMQNPVVLPAPHSRNHDKVIKKFISRWENYLKFQFLSKHGEGSKWSEFSHQSEYFSSHIQYSVISLFDCLSRGDRNGAEWMADVLIKWYRQLEFQLSRDHYHLYRHQKLLTIDMCYLDWEKVCQNIKETGENVVAAPSPFSVFSSCLHNLWEDAGTVTLLLLAEWSCNCSGEKNLPAELFGSVLNIKSLRSGEEIRQQGKLVNNFNKLLEVIIRQQFTENAGEYNYEKRLSKIVDGVRELSRTEMISGRMYTGWGANDLRSVGNGRILLLLLLATENWKPNDSLHRTISIWTLTNNERVRYLKDEVDRWKSALVEFNSELFENTYETLRRSASTGQPFDIAKQFLASSIEAIRNVLDLAHQEAIQTVEIDSNRLQDIEKWASSEAFSSGQDKFPLGLFKQISHDQSPKNPFSLTIQRMNKGEFTSPLLAQPVANEEEWFARTVQEYVAAYVLNSSLSKLEIKEIPTPTPESYWMQFKAFVDEARAKKLTPILLLENPTIPEWVWDWQNSSYDSSIASVPPDLTITRENVWGTDSYQCSFNGVPVFSTHIQPGSSLLVVKESFSEVSFTEFIPGIFVKVATSDIDESPGLIDLVLNWQTEIDIISHPAVRLLYGQNTNDE